MNKRVRHVLGSGFTLIELMVVVALVAIVLMLAAPSFRDMIEMQRLRSINAQFLTDVQFTRTEAVSRQERVVINFKWTTGMTCYVVHTCGNRPDNLCSCDCSLDTACTTTPNRESEVRKVQLPVGGMVKLIPPTFAASPGTTQAKLVFDPATGAQSTWARAAALGWDRDTASEFRVEASIIRDGATPTLRTDIGTLGRAKVCTPNALVNGVSAC